MISMILWLNLRYFEVMNIVLKFDEFWTSFGNFSVIMRVMYVGWMSFWLGSWILKEFLVEVL